MTNSAPAISTSTFPRLLLACSAAALLAGCFSWSDERVGPETRDYGQGSTWAKKPEPAGAAALRLPPADFSVLAQGAGGRLSVDDLAVARVSWTQGGRSGEAWVTLGTPPPGAGPTDKQSVVALRRVCDPDKIPTRKCLPDAYGAVHPLNALLRSALDWREVGSEARLALSDGPVAKSLAREAGAGTDKDPANPFPGIELSSLDADPLVLKIRLEAACFPKWVKRTSTTHSVPAMKSTRSEIFLDSCEDMGAPGKKQPTGSLFRTVKG